MRPRKHRMNPTEEFISYIWKNQKLDPAQLQTVHGDAITVIKPGMLNTNAGPDFLEAKVNVGNTEWHGSVELHVRTSDWERHGHTGDPKYNNIILHVVWEHDKEISALSKVPTLVLRDAIPTEIIDQYQELSAPYRHIPCEQFLHEIDNFLRSSWLSRMLVERLETKVYAIQEDYLDLGSNLNESFYRLMGKAFGQKVNQHGFDVLTRALSLKILLKHADKISDLEALLFGVAGMLVDAKDDYQNELQQRYAHFRHKYNLIEVPDGTWNFLRLRPANFPTIRLAQFAALIHRAGDFMTLPTKSPNFDRLQELLHVKASKYWDNHYTFGKESAVKSKWISKGFFQHLVVNVFVPFGFYYKRRTGAASLDWVEEMLGKLSGEDNVVTRNMVAAGFKNNTSMESQALYHLNRSYCTRSKCLSCAVGNAVLSRKLV